MGASDGKRAVISPRTMSLPWRVLDEKRMRSSFPLSRVFVRIASRFLLFGPGQLVCLGQHR